MSVTPPVSGSELPEPSCTSRKRAAKTPAEKVAKKAFEEAREPFGEKIKKSVTKRPKTASKKAEKVFKKEAAVPMEVEVASTRRRKAESSLEEYLVKSHAEAEPRQPKKGRLSREETVATFLKDIEAAKSSENPLQQIAASQDKIMKLYGVDVNYRPFLKDLKLLTEQLENRPEQVKKLLFPLLQEAFTGKRTLAGAHFLGGGLLYLLDRGIYPENLDTIQDSVKDVLEADKELLIKQLNEHKKCGIYETNEVKEIFIPQLIASSLILKNGSFNSGMILEVKASIISSKPERRGIGFRAHDVLDQFESDELLQQLLESIEAPAKNSYGERVVNESLYRPVDQECTSRDARIIAFGSCLTKWRQKEVGNCFIAGFHLEMREARLRWYLEDLKELLASGSIKRGTPQQPEKEIRLFALEYPITRALKKKIDALDPHLLFQNPAIHNACSLLGCESVDEFVEIWNQVKRPNASLNDVLEKICSVNGASAETLQRARCMVEAPTQALLSQNWENAFAGLFVVQSREKIQTFLERMGDDFVYIVFDRKDPESHAIVKSIVEEMHQEWGNIRFSLVPSVTDPDRIVQIPYIERQGEAHPFYSLEFFGDKIWKIETELVKRISSHQAFLPLLSEEALQYKPDPVRTFEFLTGFLSNFDQPFAGQPDAHRVAEIGWGFISEKVFVEKAWFSFTPKREIRVDTVNVFEPYSRIAGWFSRFTEMSQEVQKTYGNDPSFSLIACSPTHLFRLLPNHPTLSWMQRESFEQRTAELREEFARPRWSKDEAAIRIHELCQNDTHILEHETQEAFTSLPEKSSYSVNDILL